MYCIGRYEYKGLAHTTYLSNKNSRPLLNISPLFTLPRPAARLLRSWVRIPPGAWIFVCCECRVLSGRGLCDELITCPEESYRLCCVVVCDLETSGMGAPYIYDISRLRVKGQYTCGVFLKAFENLFNCFQCNGNRIYEYF